MKSSLKCSKTILIVDRAGAQSIWSLMDNIRLAAEAQGHIVHTVRWDDGRGANEDQKDRGARDHVITVRPKRKPWDTLLQHRQFAPQFSRLLNELKPDVLHANFIVPGGLAMRIARRAGVSKIIATRHELAGSLSSHLKICSNFSARYADHLVHVSSTVAQSYGCANAPIYSQGNYSQGKTPRDIVIYNGIDLNTLSQVRPYPRKGEEKVIVVAGRMVPVKGQLRAVEAFILAAQKDKTLRLELIGDGPDRAMLERLSGEANLKDRVTFTGWRPLSETHARMKSAWKVIIPSDGSQEGFGLVLAEAMELGVPVIASKIKVFHEVSKMGSAVVLANCSSPEQLAVTIFEDPIQTSADATKLDKSIMEKSYISLYQNLLYS